MLGTRDQQELTEETVEDDHKWKPELYFVLQDGKKTSEELHSIRVISLWVLGERKNGFYCVCSRNHVFIVFRLFKGS